LQSGIGVTLFGLACLFAAKTEAATAPATLLIDERAVAAGNTQRQAAEVTIINNGNVAILAYVLTLTSENSKGKSCVRSTSRLVKTESADADQHALVRGKRWTHPRKFFVPLDAQGRPRQYKIELDFVRFADGTRWGEDRAGQAAEIEGFLRGTAAAKLQMREELRRGGPAALQKRLDNR
jgi:hypothetical protein